MLEKASLCLVMLQQPELISVFSLIVAWFVQPLAPDLNSVFET